MSRSATLYMNDIWKDIPWTKKDVYINFIALITTLVMGTITLALKSWLFLLIFWLLWALYAVVGRYVTCRHCEYYGKACPSWLMGLIGAKLYKRSDKKCFIEGGLWKMIVFDVSFMTIAILLPIILYISLLFSEGLLALDWIILIVYTISGLMTLMLHSALGCRKCPIKECPMCRNKE